MASWATGPPLAGTAPRGGDHRERAHHQGHSLTLRGQGLAGAAGGAWGGLHAQAGFEAMNRDALAAGRRCSSTRATPLPAACASSIHASPPAAPQLLRLRRGSRWRRAGESHWSPQSAQGLGAAAQPGSEAQRGAAGCQAFTTISWRRGDLPYEIDGVVYKVDDIAPQGARFRGPRAALGHRPQVPGRRGDDGA